MKQRPKFGRPPKGERTQTDRINLRADPEEKARFETAARKAGLSLTDWMKDRLRRAVRRELGD
jgi:uncharacterized protein (DUF1778 family)